MVALYFVLLNVLLLESVIAAEWGYSGKAGPPNWYHDFPICNENRQSPINIATDKATGDDDIGPVKYHGYDETLTGGTISNNGHTVVLQMPSGKAFTISGGGFDPNRYRALQLHFHWSATGSTAGSEHTINGKHFPLEMHIVHIKEPYNLVADVRDMSDGLAVLSVMFDVGSEENKPLQKLLDLSGNLEYAGSSATVSDGPQLEELLPSSTTFYRYFGSLTTPPCYETVLWTIFSEPSSISQSQLAAFQSLKSVKHDFNTSIITHGQVELGGNFRPVQPLNDRDVIFAGKYVKDVEVQHPSIILILLSALLGLFVFIALVAVVKRCCCDKPKEDTAVLYTKAGRSDA